MDLLAVGFGLGAVVGLILALTGAGGGILAVPLLVFGLHLSIAQAAPVGLIAVGLASALGALLGLREGIVRYRAALLIGLAGMACAPLGVRLAHAISNGPLTLAFSAVLVHVGVRMLRQSRSIASTDERPRPACVVDIGTGRLSWSAPCARALAGTGIASGLLSGLLGVGGGFVIVPSLTRFSDLDPRSILATSLAVIALVSVGGVLGASAQGAIAWPVAGPFALGALAALALGRRVAAHITGARLQQAFAVACWCVAALLVARALGAAS